MPTQNPGRVDKGYGKNLGSKRTATKVERDYLTTRGGGKATSSVQSQNRRKSK